MKYLITLLSVLFLISCTNENDLDTTFKKKSINSR